MLYEWPHSAAFGRVIPKSRIYEHARAGARLKELFVREVDQIIWSHKLAPETINLPATNQVREIQVFRVKVRSLELDHDVLRAIDKAIPFPLLFELLHDDRIRMVAAYKRPNEADTARWVVGNYFEGDWQPSDAVRRPLPVVLNMGALYEQLLAPLVAARVHDAVGPTYGFGEAPQAHFTRECKATVPLQARIAQADQVKRQLRKVEQIEVRLKREKQFNRRVAINAELRVAKQVLERLMAGHARPDKKNG